MSTASDTMVMNFNEWGDLTIDLDSLSLWTSSGDPDDELPPLTGEAGALAALDRLYAQNAAGMKRLADR